MKSNMLFRHILANKLSILGVFDHVHIDLPTNQKITESYHISLEI